MATSVADGGVNQDSDRSDEKDDSNGGTRKDTLFRGQRLWFSEAVPMRKWLIENAKHNGAIVTTDEKLADIRLVDHLRKNIPPGCFSYKYVELSIRNGQLEDLQAHLVGVDSRVNRPVGSRVNATKLGRAQFTDAEDQFLWNWMIPFIDAGGSWKGLEVYKQIEAVNPRHSFQSWRSRWIDKTMYQKRQITAISGARERENYTEESAASTSTPTNKRGRDESHEDETGVESKRPRPSSRREWRESRAESSRSVPSRSDHALHEPGHIRKSVAFDIPAVSLEQKQQEGQRATVEAQPGKTSERDRSVRNRGMSLKSPRSSAAAVHLSPKANTTQRNQNPNHPTLVDSDPLQERYDVVPPLRTQGSAKSSVHYSEELRRQGRQTSTFSPSLDKTQGVQALVEKGRNLSGLNNETIPINTSLQTQENGVTNMVSAGDANNNASDKVQNNSNETSLNAISSQIEKVTTKDTRVSAKGTPEHHASHEKEDQSKSARKVTSDISVKLDNGAEAIFSRIELKRLYKTAPDILHTPTNAVDEVFRKIALAYPSHNAEEWKTFFETIVAPKWFKSQSQKEKASAQPSPTLEQLKKPNSQLHREYLSPVSQPIPRHDAVVQQPRATRKNQVYEPNYASIPASTFQVRSSPTPVRSSLSGNLEAKNAERQAPKRQSLPSSSAPPPNSWKFVRAKIPGSTMPTRELENLSQYHTRPQFTQPPPLQQPQIGQQSMSNISKVQYAQPGMILTYDQYGRAYWTTPTVETRQDYPLPLFIPPSQGRLDDQNRATVSIHDQNRMTHQQTSVAAKRAVHTPPPPPPSRLPFPEEPKMNADSFDGEVSEVHSSPGLIFCIECQTKNSSSWFHSTDGRPLCQDCSRKSRKQHELTPGHDINLRTPLPKERPITSSESNIEQRTQSFGSQSQKSHETQLQSTSIKDKDIINNDLHTPDTSKSRKYRMILPSFQLQPPTTSRAPEPNEARKRIIHPGTQSNSQESSKGSVVSHQNDTSIRNYPQHDSINDEYIHDSQTSTRTGSSQQQSQPSILQPKSTKSGKTLQDEPLNLSVPGSSELRSNNLFLDDYTGETQMPSPQPSLQGEHSTNKDLNVREISPLFVPQEDRDEIPETLNVHTLGSQSSSSVVIPRLRNDEIFETQEMTEIQNPNRRVSSIPANVLSGPKLIERMLPPSTNWRDLNDDSDLGSTIEIAPDEFETARDVSQIWETAPESQTRLRSEDENSSDYEEISETIENSQSEVVSPKKSQTSQPSFVSQGLIQHKNKSDPNNERASNIVEQESYDQPSITFNTKAKFSKPTRGSFEHNEDQSEEILEDIENQSYLSQASNPAQVNNRVETQALFEKSYDGTSEIDFTLPLPDEEEWDMIESRPDKVNEMQTDEFESDDTEDIDVWLATQTNNYNDIDDIESILHLAIQATSFHFATAEKVVVIMTNAQRRSGKPAADIDLPKNVSGCWTAEDDKDLFGSDARRIEALERKHGEDFFNRRVEFLEQWLN